MLDLAIDKSVEFYLCALSTLQLPLIWALRNYHIAQRWLLERRIEHGIARVKEALAELVSKGLILENEGRDSRVQYRLNQSKYEEILTLIK